MDAAKNSLLKYVWHVLTTILKLQGNHDDCEEIEAGMATSFNNLCSATFTEIRLIFMISMIFQRAPRATVFNYIAQNTLKLHTSPKENEQEKIYLYIRSHHPK